MLPDVRHAVIESAVFKAFFPTSRASDQAEDDAENNQFDDLEEHQSVFKRIRASVKFLHKSLQAALCTTEQDRAGIYLVTPVDINKRK